MTSDISFTADKVGAIASPDRLRTLGPVLATLTVAGCMIGSGIFMLPASLGGLGSVTILSWLVATAGAGLIGGSLAWLAVLDPAGGGMFSYIRKAFGPAVGFVAGVLYWASGVPGGVAIAIACTGYFSVFMPQAAREPGSTLSTVGFVWLLIAANWVGPRFVARLQGWTLALGLVPVLLAALGGWFFFHGATFAQSWNPGGASLFAVVPRGAVMAFWAFIGIEGAVILAPRVRNPGRNVAIATLGGLGLAAAIYIAACAALMGILPASVLAKSSAPFADAAAAMMGASLGGAVALCALLKASGTLGAGMLLTLESLECESVTCVLSEVPRAMPRVSAANLLFTGVISTLIVLVSQSPTLVRQFTMVTNVVVVVSMLIYAAACLALLRAASVLPLKQKIAAWTVSVGGALFCAFIVAASEPDLLVWSVLPVVGALIAYVVAATRQQRRRAALPQV
jgi:arginine:agmatine antiporter